MADRLGLLAAVIPRGEQKVIQGVSAATARSLLAGLIYLLAWIASLVAGHAIGQQLALHDTPRARRTLAWHGWDYLARILGLAFTLTCLYLALAYGYLEPFTIGLVPANWQEVSDWLPAVAGFSSLWTALLWGLYWAPYQHREDHSPWQAYGTPLGLPAHVLNLEMQSTILRGALIPLLGAYWGPWAACLVRASVSLANPAIRMRLENSQARAFLMLDLAVDVVATGCFIVSGNLWVSLLVRTAAHFSAGAVHRLMLWKSRHSVSPTSTG